MLQSDAEKERASFCNLDLRRQENGKSGEKADAENNEITITAICPALCLNNDALVAYKDAVKAVGISAQNNNGIEKLSARKDSLELLTFENSDSTVNCLRRGMRFAK